jgi:nicotinamide-nucleotide amidase
MFSKTNLALAEDLMAQCRASGLQIATAESCTGGLVSALLTSIAGASDVFTHGFVTYANEAKTSMLQVPQSLLISEGAVSEKVARAMAQGALLQAQTQLAVSITGIAGPGGGSAEKPVGLVHIACASDLQETLHQQHYFNGNREAIRASALHNALILMLKALDR